MGQQLLPFSSHNGIVKKERLKGRTTEVLSTNLELDNIQSGLQTIFKNLEMTDAISLEHIKSEYLGKKEEVETMMTLFDKHNKDIAKQVGISVSAATFKKLLLSAKLLFIFTNLG